MRVLVVAENVSERLRAVSALALHADAVVTEAASGEEARQELLAEHDAYDVVVVDGDLQPRGGFAILYDLRQQATLQELTPLPSLVLISREQDRWLADWAGANDTMLKPVDSFRLSKRVKELVGQTAPPYGGSGGTAQQVAAALGETGDGGR
ncbi:response regulator [Egicoccus halophilus]|uniref:response regulator n=1 Tax=Egicoccus halophilus TaxID=1670830 RepID=UPI0013EEAC57|nr:response regulator [Egicoccus halophilus]